MAVAKKRGLGKGLEALFENSELDTEKIPVNKDEAGEQKGITFVDLNEIKPNENQPRKEFNEEKLQELAKSIEEHGLIQPIILRKAEKGYEIVAGERRWRASRIAKLKEIPCIIRELTDEQNMLLAIIENMQREDLNPIEEAEGLNQMIHMFGLTQEQVSESIGKSRPYITNSIRLLKLQDDVKNMVSAGELSMGHGRALLAVSDEEKQLKLAKYAASEGISVRALESLIKDGLEQEQKPARRRAEKNANIKRLEEDLKALFGTKVSLNQNGKKGKIQIEYYSREDLERLIDLLKSIG